MMGQTQLRPDQSLGALVVCTGLGGSATPRRPGAAAGRALVLTRSPRLAHLAGAVLRRQGWGVVTARHAVAGIEPFAVVLLDLRLAGALDVLTALRRDGGADAVIIAVAAGSTSADVVAGALGRGADQLCTLPLRPRELAAGVRVLLRRRAEQHVLQARLTQTEIVARLGAAIAAAADLEGALRALHLGAGELTGSEMGVIRLLDGPAKQEAPLRVYRRIGREQFAWETERLAAGSNTARVLADGAPIYARDLAAEAAAGNPFAADGLERYGVRSSLNVPLRSGGRIVGTLHVDSPRAEAFCETQLRPLQFLADHAADAVDRARLYAAAEASAAAASAALARFEGVLRAATEYAIIGTDVEGAITLFNTGAERMLGCSAANAVGKLTPAAFLDAAELAAHAARLGVAPGFAVLAAEARRGKAETREWTCFRRDHSRLAAMLTVTAMHDGEGALTGYIAMLRDITAQKMAETELRPVATSARCVLWRAVVEQRDGAFAWSIQISEEAAAQRLLNIEVLPGQEYSQAWHHSKSPEDRVHMEARANEALRSGKAHYTQEFRCRQRDGGLLWLWEDVRIEPLDPGRWRLDGVATDITERKQVEAELARQHGEAERTRSQIVAILDASVEAMVLIAPDQRLLTVNRRFGEFFDVQPADVLGRRLGDLLPARLGEELARLLADADCAVEAGIPAGDEEAGVRLVSQQWPQQRELALVCCEVHGNDGYTCLGRLYVLRDVTRERQVDNLKAQFVSLVSHELRTPLTSIKGYTDLMLAGEVGRLTADQHEFLAIVKSNADRLVVLTNDLLDITRLEAGKLELKRSVLQLDALIREVAGCLRPQIEARRQRLTLELAGLGSTVLADPDRTAQILTNLLSNAHKYTPPDGRIVVSAVEEGSWVRVAIRDSGVGLTPEEQLQLFTRFFRAKNPATREVGGTGLGLTITRSLVELHGGTIEVMSAPGQGSTFSFTLPLAGDAGATTRPAERRP